MSKGLIQFNKGEHILGNKNVSEAVITDGDIVFNESYIVIGERFEAKRIYATYDLDVLTNIYAENISVNGDLFVKGDIEACELTCRGAFVCTGEVRVKKLNLESYVVAGSIVGEDIYSCGEIFVRNTIDTSSSFEAENLVVAGEGIMGEGSFNAKVVIANEYFEFTGKSNSKIFEISEIDEETGVEPENVEIVDVAITFNNVLAKSFNEWGELEEEELISNLREVTASMSDLHFVNRIIDRVVELSYEREITNFRDYLYILCANNIFPKELAEYETLTPVLDGMFNDVVHKVDKMEYKAVNVDEFACSLYILDMYQNQLPISIEEGADKIFSSIGLRYSTVEHAWRDCNG